MKIAVVNKIACTICHIIHYVDSYSNRFPQSRRWSEDLFSSYERPYDEMTVSMYELMTSSPVMPEMFLTLEMRVLSINRSMQIDKMRKFWLKGPIKMLNKAEILLIFFRRSSTSNEMSLNQTGISKIYN
jgi:hypothetical protein